MKICPTCNQTYTDPSLNFCLSDGSVLNPVNSNDTSQPTVFMGQPPSTNQNPPFVNPTQGNPTIPQYNRGLSQSVPPRPAAKKSNAWLWIVGIVGAIVVVAGIGFIGIVALVASNLDDPSANNSTINSKNETPSNSSDVKYENVRKDDLSKWRKDSNDYGTSEFSNGEFIMSSKQNGFFYVLVTADKTMKTSEAAIKVTVRNVNGTLTKTGYGIIIHSDPNAALVKDYGFLIDSAKQSYRIVQHASSKETVLTDWTRFPGIRSGTQTNEIEIKDQNGKMTFNINGQFALSVNDTVKYKDGVFGLYAGDAIPVAFSNLQLSK